MPGRRTPPGQVSRRPGRSLASDNRRRQRLVRPEERVNGQTAQGYSSVLVNASPETWQVYGSGYPGQWAGR